MKQIFQLSFLLLFGCFQIHINAQINYPEGSVYSYLKGNEAADLDAGWMNSDFNTNDWNVGSAPFRYGDGSGGTLLDDMRNTYSTLFLKSTFSASSTADIKQLNLYVNYDDGFAVWINGERVLAQNCPDPLNSASFASALHESGTATKFLVDSGDFHLVEGENHIAALALNYDLSSSDFYFDLGIEAEPELTPLPNWVYEDSIRFSHDAGMYYSNFNLELSNANSDYNILYTLDGSDPSSSNSISESAGPVSISVDPDLTQTSGFIVRASLQKEGYQPSSSICKSYIFPEKVADQNHPGGDWPLTSINNQRLDFEIDPEVSHDPLYEDQFLDALLEIPSISIATDNMHLFDPQSGIYVNAEQKGIEWERPCSVELLNPTSGKGFQINAGLRIRGGNSAKNKNNPKHAFRLFFRSKYGNPKLEYPLFEDEGAQKYDCIDLRCEQNYSWSMDGSYHNTMVKDIFARDLQGSLKQAYKKGRYYHLYINGMYWGIFQSDERAEADFASTYLGGDEEDYDIIKVDTRSWPYYCEATDGNMDAWNELWRLCETGFNSNEAYNSLQGLNADGSLNPSGNCMVDINNLIDYMLVIFYTGNFDAPVSAWYGNDMPNNFYAIYNRKNRSQGFKFAAHDSEHSMFVESVFGHQGVNENRTNLGSSGSMQINRALDFNPQWLHYRLCQNEEYRLRFSDRAYEVLDENGILSPENAKLLFQKRAEQIDTAIIAESARWGDAQSATPLTRDNDWIPEINRMYDEFFPLRTSILRNQLSNEALFPDLSTPKVFMDSQEITTNKISFSGTKNIRIQTSESNTAVYYTSNGTDPRKTGGDISSDAKTGINPIEFSLSETTEIKARVFSEDTWGPLKSILLSNELEDYANLKFTEIHYHPNDSIADNDTISGKNFEFIELKNTGHYTLDLSKFILDSAVRYTFPEECLLNAGDFYVVAAKPNNFFTKYERYPSGNFAGQLSNGGERIILCDSKGNVRIDFRYKDEHPWPLQADGLGYSLVSTLNNPTDNPENASYWKASSQIDGSPFRDDNPATIEEMNMPEIQVQVYPNPSNSTINIAISGTLPYERISVKLVSTSGKQVFNSKTGSLTSIDLRSLGISDGLYILVVQHTLGIQTERILFLTD